MAAKNSLTIGEDYTICDLCNNYESVNNGCVEICHARRIGSKKIIHMDENYINERMAGNKTSCKEFTQAISVKAFKEWLNK